MLATQLCVVRFGVFKAIRKCAGFWAVRVVSDTNPESQHELTHVTILVSLNFAEFRLGHYGISGGCNGVLETSAGKTSHSAGEHPTDTAVPSLLEISQETNHLLQ
jgi:hypothetical protein